MNILKAFALMLFCVPAMAAIVHLRNPPAPEGFPPFSLTDVPYQYVTGFDGSGNVVGVVGYYSNSSHGVTVKALVTWDLTGKPLSAIPCSQTQCDALVYGPLETAGGYPVFVAGAEGGYTIGILDSAPRVAVIVTP